MESCTALAVRTAPSSCGRHAGNHMGSGDEAKQGRTEVLCIQHEEVSRFGSD